MIETGTTMVHVMRQYVHADLTEGWNHCLGRLLVH
jgi:hypothetical protein